jgi:hypothetical protein
MWSSKRWPSIHRVSRIPDSHWSLNSTLSYRFLYQSSSICHGHKLENFAHFVPLLRIWTPTFTLGAKMVMIMLWVFVLVKVPAV